MLRIRAEGKLNRWAERAKAEHQETATHSTVQEPSAPAPAQAEATDQVAAVHVSRPGGEPRTGINSPNRDDAAIANFIAAKGVRHVMSADQVAAFLRDSGHT